MIELRCVSEHCGFQYTAEEAAADARGFLRSKTQRAMQARVARLELEPEALIFGAACAALSSHLVDNPTHVVETTWRVL